MLTLALNPHFTSNKPRNSIAVRQKRKLLKINSKSHLERITRLPTRCPKNVCQVFFYYLKPLELIIVNFGTEYPETQLLDFPSHLSCVAKLPKNTLEIG